MIAICIGHSRGDGGAVSAGGVNEWHYNRALGQLILQNLRDRDYEAIMIDRYARTGYGRAMDLLAASLKSQKVKVAVELHFNSADSASATGHEWLYWFSSVAGRRLAQCFSYRMGETFPAHKKRGLVPIRSEKEDGGGFLRKTFCPAVICEPFFGSNPKNWWMMSEHKDLLAKVITDGIDDWMGGAE
jgi:N-acetylmuramoyl-L-alanine amidase